MSIAWILGSLCNSVLSEANQSDYELMSDQAMCQSSQWNNYYAYYLVLLVSRNTVQGTRHFVHLCTIVFHQILVSRIHMVMSYYNLMYVPAAMCLAFGIILIQAFGFKIIPGVRFLSIFSVVPTLLRAMRLSSKFGNNSAGSPNLNIKASNKL